MDEPKSRSLDVLGIKPVAKSVDRLTKATIDGASAFLSVICLPAAEELGLLIKDKVANWRAQNAVKVAEASRRKLEDRNIRPEDVQAHPRIVGQIIENSSWADTDEVQKMWAGLLAASCTPDGRDESNLIFCDILSKLTSLQASLIMHACETAVKHANFQGLVYADQLIVGRSDIERICLCSDIHRPDRELDYLRSLELISVGLSYETDEADITPTSLCLHLYMRCLGESGDPLAFYNLEPEQQAQDSG